MRTRQNPNSGILEFARPAALACLAMFWLAACGQSDDMSDLSIPPEGDFASDANAQKDADGSALASKHGQSGHKSHLPPEHPAGDKIKSGNKAMYLRENGSYVRAYDGFEIEVGGEIVPEDRYEIIDGRRWWNFARVMGAPATPPVTLWYRIKNGKSLIPGTGPVRGVRWLYGLNHTNLEMGLDFKPESMSFGGETGQSEGFVHHALGKAIQKDQATALIAKGGKIVYEGRAFALPKDDPLVNPLEQGSFTFTLDLDSKEARGEIRGLSGLRLKVREKGEHKPAPESLEGVDRIELLPASLMDHRGQPLWNDDLRKNEAKVHFKNGQAPGKATYGFVAMGPEADEIQGEVAIDGHKAAIFLGDKASR